MSTPLRRFGLMAAFAEFSLLPELLASVPSAPGTDPPDSWRNILDSHGYNVDHVEEGERPPGSGLTELMVGDAWALVNRLGLVDGDGLTQTGRTLAGLDATEGSNATLAQAARTTYRGHDGAPLVDLLQHEARRVQAGEADGGAGYCPGLLLAEVITLIEHACLPSPRPRRALLDIRREIEELVIQPDAQRSRNAARCEFADAVSAHHMQASTETQYGEWVPMTLTEARATSMLLTAAGLLDLEFPIGPAQCLAPPKGLATPAATRDRIDAEDGVRIDVRGGAWQLNAPPQAAGAILAQLMRHDLGTNSKIFRDLGIDMAVRRAKDNVPYLEDPGIREYRMINKALAMELLCSLWLESTDSPKRVVCHCETRHGLPHRFAPPLTHDAEARALRGTLSRPGGGQRQARNRTLALPKAAGAGAQTWPLACGRAGHNPARLCACDQRRTHRRRYATTGGVPRVCGGE